MSVIGEPVRNSDNVSVSAGPVASSQGDIQAAVARARTAVASFVAGGRSGAEYQAALREVNGIMSAAYAASLPEDQRSNIISVAKQEWLHLKASLEVRNPDRGTASNVVHGLDAALDSALEPVSNFLRNVF